MYLSKHLTIFVASGDGLLGRKYKILLKKLACCLDAKWEWTLSQSKTIFALKWLWTLQGTHTYSSKYQDSLLSWQADPALPLNMDQKYASINTSILKTSDQ